MAALFRSTAEGETGHAHGHLEWLEQCGDPATGLPIGSTRDNLKAAVAGETHEYTDMYPGMAKTRTPKAMTIADWFETLAKAERSRQPLPPRRWPNWWTDPSAASAHRSTGAFGAFCRGATGPLGWLQRFPRNRRRPRTTHLSPRPSHAMAREGNLEAPTRHPSTGRTRLLERRGHVQGDGAHLRHLPRLPALREPVRIVPTLFDLVDEGKTGEVDGVDKKDYWKVVDQCYLCDLCYLTKCPYVPPHEWNLDFPHTMLRPRPSSSKGRGHGRRELLASTDIVHGSFAGIPIVVQAVNAVNKTRWRAGDGKSMLAWTRTPGCPALATKSSAGRAGVKAHAVKDGAKTPGKVAIYSTCYINYNEPGIGRPAEGAGPQRVPYVLVEKESAAACPSWSWATWSRSMPTKQVNIPVLARATR